jgi:hypothetical protein
MSEQKKDELLDSTEKVNVEEKKEEKQCGQFTPLSLTLMILICLGIIGWGCWYTYYQYNRMDEVNKAKTQ